MEVSVSFLSDYNYKELIKEINKTSCDYIHFDVMDGRFVKTKNLDVDELKELLSISNKKNDIHLMVQNPMEYVDHLKNCNIEYITVHYEASDVVKSIKEIKRLGYKVGVAINPDTSYSVLKDLLDSIDLILVMSVVPGKSGQSFIPDVSSKIDNLKEIIKDRNLNVKISVDGGINNMVLKYVSNADILVSASYVLNDFKNIEILKNGKY